MMFLNNFSGHPVSSFVPEDYITLNFYFKDNKAAEHDKMTL